MNTLWQWIRRYLSPRTPFKLSALILLLVMLVVGAAPGYLQGNWRWSWVGPINNLSELRDVRETGIDIPSWVTVEQGQRQVGSKKWSIQVIQEAGTEVASESDENTDESTTVQILDDDPPQQIEVMLLPILADTDQPQVEWSDWEGVARIETDSERFFDLQTTTGRQRSTFTVRLLRGWMANNRTLMMAQWYAWPGGGSPRPSDWFWADRGSQIRRYRLPWIAVNVVMETKRPLDELDDYQDSLKDVAIDIQKALIQGPLKPVEAS